jgi:hypothetical protein
MNNEKILTGHSVYPNLAKSSYAWSPTLLLHKFGEKKKLVLFVRPAIKRYLIYAQGELHGCRKTLQMKIE